MTDLALLDERPVLVAIAGPNGAGKTTFYHAHLEGLGLRFVNADVLAAELDIGAYKAAEIADALRSRLLSNRESFVFETVFSDPVNAKLSFLEDAERHGYTVALCFVGLRDADLSVSRVAMRESQGGHDVPDEKLRSRFPRVMNNLGSAIRRLRHVFVFDNSDFAAPFRHVATFEAGVPSRRGATPAWLERVLAH